MKTIALTLFAAALGFAQSQSAASPATTPATTSAPKDAPKAATAQKSGAQNKKPAQPAPPQKAAAQPVTIPAGAKLVEPNLYRFTDSNGKTWNYRQTPFGISKWEETPAAQPGSAAASPTNSQGQGQAKSEPVAVTDLGDSYRFEKKTPFGASSWVRKKSELTDEEQVLVGTRTSADSKPAGNQ